MRRRSGAGHEPEPRRERQAREPASGDSGAGTLRRLSRRRPSPVSRGDRCASPAGNPYELGVRTPWSGADRFLGRSDRRAGQPPRMARRGGGRRRAVDNGRSGRPRPHSADLLGGGGAEHCRIHADTDLPGPHAIATGPEIRQPLDRTPGEGRTDMSVKPIIALVVAILFLPVLAGAATSDTGRLEGRLPDNTPLVSIDQTRGTVLDALGAVSKQTGWSLVVTAPESATTRPLAMQASKRPAGDVLNLILEAGSLRASFADGVLRVRSDVPAASGVTARERRRERGRHRGAERVVVGQSLSVGADEVVDKAVAVGGSVSVEEGASLEGDNVSLGGTIPTMIGSVTRWAVGGRPHLRSMFGF